MVCGELSAASFRGLEDLKVSCASVHSDHSSGLAKPLQEYRYTHTHTRGPRRLAPTRVRLKVASIIPRALFFGENEIAVRVPSLFKLLIKEVRCCATTPRVHRCCLLKPRVSSPLH